MSSTDQPAEVRVVERFELALATVQDARGEALTVPVVDGWIQIEFALARPPSPTEEADFFHRLRAVREAAAGPDAPAWFFLHKSPGLKLRLRTGADGGRIVATVAAAHGLATDWLSFAGFGSFFDQAELRPAAFRPDADAMLAAAADALLDAADAGVRGGAEAWAAALMDVALGHTDGDGWIAYELLARLGRLRLGSPPPSAPEPEPFHPGDLASRLPRTVAPGFEASVALVQALNMTLNLWAVGPRLQAAALDLALGRLRPSIRDAAG